MSQLTYPGLFIHQVHPKAHRSECSFSMYDLQVAVRIRGPFEDKLPSCIRGATETSLVLAPPEGRKA